MTEELGKVVEVLNPNDPREVVVNRGTAHSVFDGQRVVVFARGKEVVDPDTGDSLGTLEILRGRGEVVHTQEKMCTIRCTEMRRVQKERLRKKIPGVLNSLSAVIEPFEYVTDAVETEVPFENVKVGDLVRF